MVVVVGVLVHQGRCHGHRRCHLCRLSRRRGRASLSSSVSLMMSPLSLSSCCRCLSCPRRHPRPCCRPSRFPCPKILNVSSNICVEGVYTTIVFRALRRRTPCADHRTRPITDNYEGGSSCSGIQSSQFTQVGGPFATSRRESTWKKTPRT